jgi:hypothetical protein
MIAIDTNVLVHAHRGDSPFHEKAVAAITRAAEARWAIPWPCIHEFVAVVTHPKIFDPPSTMKDAIRAVDGWREADGLSILAETDVHWDTLTPLLGAGVAGPRTHDARIAALCIQHAVTELWTADRDFSRFPAVRVRNPLV